VTFKSTLSAIDLSKIGDLIASLNDFSNSMVNGLDDYATKITDIRNTISNSNEEYGKKEPIKGIKEDFDYIDLYYFAQLVMQQIGDENIRNSVAEVIANIQNVIIGEWHQALHTNSHGLSIYFPETKGLFQCIGYSKLDFANSSSITWKSFLEEYLNKADKQLWAVYKPLLSGIMIGLSESQGKLYLHVYDSSGNHVGFDYELNATEIGISEAFYLDFQNGTTVVVFLGNINEFKLMVDASHAEEQTETYDITISIIRDAQISNQTRVTHSIQKDEQHEFLVKTLSDGTIQITPYPKSWVEQYWIVLAAILALLVGGSLLVVTKYKKKPKTPSSKPQLIKP